MTALARLCLSLAAGRTQLLRRHALLQHLPHSEVEKPQAGARGRQRRKQQARGRKGRVRDYRCARQGGWRRACQQAGQLQPDAQRARRFQTCARAKRLQTLATQW